MTSPLMPRDEVATLWGIDPDAVRSTVRRYGISEVRGYPRAAVEAVKRPGQGRRTDLHALDTTETQTMTQAMPEIIVTLPAADPAEGDPTSWIGHLGDQWTAFEDRIEDTNGNALRVDDVRDSALAMLAAVHQVKLWDAERAAGTDNTCGHDPGECVAGRRAGYGDCCSDCNH